MIVSWGYYFCFDQKRFLKHRSMQHLSSLFCRSAQGNETDLKSQRTETALCVSFSADAVSVLSADDFKPLVTFTFQGTVGQT